MVDLAEKIEVFCEDNVQLFRGSDIQINKEDDVCYYCSINPSLFHMLLMNLLSNAIQYNKTDSPRITITFSQTDKNIRVSFIDNGIGFEKSYVKKIFRKFFQIERADWSESGGTGLGLYMAEQVIKFHKG